MGQLPVISHHIPVMIPWDFIVQPPFTWICSCSLSQCPSRSGFRMKKYFTSSDPRHGISRHILGHIHSDMLPNILSDIYFVILCAIHSGVLSGIYSGILSVIYSVILSDVYSIILTIYLVFCLTYTLTVYLTYILTFYCIWAYLLAFYLNSFRRFFVVEVRQGSLWSSGRCSGPAGATAIWRFLLGPSGDHCNLAFAVLVWRGPLRSSACSWGPAGTTLIRGLLFGSGGDHSLSRACSWRLAGTAVILSLQLRSGGGRRGSRRRKDEEGRGRRSRADIRSNNPHLTGGESHIISNSGLFFGKPMGKPWPSRSSLYPPAVTWSVGGCTVQLPRSACTSAIEFAVAALNLVDFMLFLFGTSYTLWESKMMQHTPGLTSKIKITTNMEIFYRFHFPQHCVYPS